MLRLSRRGGSRMIKETRHTSKVVGRRKTNAGSEDGEEKKREVEEEVEGA